MGWRRWVALVVVSGMVGISCSDGDGESASTTAAASTSSDPSGPSLSSVAPVDDQPSTTQPEMVPADLVAEWAPATDGNSIDLAGGVVLAVPPGALPSAATVTITNGSPGTDVLPAMVAVGEPLQFELDDDATLGAEATITFTVPPLADGEIPVAATWDGSQWAPVAGEFDPATSVLRVTTPHFSWWNVFTWDFGKIINKAISTFFGDVDTSAVPCDAGDLTDGYRAQITNAGSAFSACATIVDGDFELSIKNRRRGAFSIEMPTSWTGSVDSALDFSTLVTEAALDLSDRNFLVIPGGESATIRGHVDTGQTITMPVVQDLFTWSLDTLLFAGQVYALASGYAGSTDSLSSVIRRTSTKLDSLRDGLDCLGASSGWASAALAPDASQAAVEGFLPTIWKCAKALAGDTSITSVIATLVSLVITPFLQLYKLGEMAVDIATGSADRELVVWRVDPTSVDAATPVPSDAMLGSWSGAIVAGDASAPNFDVQVVLGTDLSTIAIPSSSCAGTLTSTANTGAVLTMTGSWQSGNCLSGGTWTFTTTGPDTLHYRWTSADGQRADEGTLTRIGAASPGSTSPSSTSSGTGWPTSANEGPSVLFVYLGTEFIFPDWVSCTDAVDICIVGTGDEVRVYQIEPELGYAISVSLAGDPRTELAAVITESAEIDQLLSS